MPKNMNVQPKSEVSLSEYRHTADQAEQTRICAAFLRDNPSMCKTKAKVVLRAKGFAAGAIESALEGMK